MKNWFIANKKSIWNVRGPLQRKPNVNGYYEATIRSERKIYSFNEVYQERHYGLNDKNKYRVYPCYADTSNKETLEWWFIYQE